MQECARINDIDFQIFNLSQSGIPFDTDTANCTLSIHALQGASFQVPDR
jgi:hypothetical protein